MKRSILAVAVLGVLPVISHAQSSVTLYGIVDAGVLYTSKTANAAGQNIGKTFAFSDSGVAPSIFGISGKEDLGGGLQAVFKIENGFSPANGGLNLSNGNFFGRQAYVGLSGNFGQIKAGLQFSPFVYALYENDARGFANFGDVQSFYGGSVLTTGVYNSNAISYTTPKIANLEGNVMLALGGKAGDFQAGRQYSASLKYDDGTLMVNSAIYDGNSGGTVNTPIPSTVAFVGRMLGATYRFDSLSVHAVFVNFKVAGSTNNYVYGGGIDYFVLPQLELNGGVWVSSDRNHTENHSLLTAIGAEYFLTKRTTLYTQVGVVNNHGAANTGLSVSYPGAFLGVQGTTVGLNAGIRHIF
ncbi:porin [Paraburkholderia elongata]|uniref:Porin n=1 Tax=Paraburkholderia elongata TaxID=2675747 RepID=A0A972NKK4_9BURK|nr:porin [Paraburkholderia elongata]NPT55071.1 porin [Paraburkholderia elongata]